MYALSNFDDVLGVVLQTRVLGGNQTHDPHANSVAHYPLNQGTNFFESCLKFKYLRDLISLHCILQRE